MGVVDRLVKTATGLAMKATSDALLRVQPVKWFSPRVEYINGVSWEAYAEQLGMAVGRQSAAQLWDTQPHLRTVVDFLARNTAQLGLHVYERMPDGGRRRADDSVAGQVLDYVDGGEMTTFDLVYAMVGDHQLYDTAYWWLARSVEAPYWKLIRIPPTWITPHPDHSNAFVVHAYRVLIGGQEVTIPAVGKALPGQGGIIRMGGYSPTRYWEGSPKVNALKATLQEQIEAAKYRKQVWDRGGRVSAVIERPVDAEPWSDNAREQFREDWYAKFTGNGPKAGGTPILEDGMKLTRIDFNAREQQYVEAAKLSLQTVASVFHVNPTMIGYTEGATYSNVKEFSRMLYTDTLGPILRQLTQRINRGLLPALGMDTARYYVEFNIQEKLAGSFEEQAAILSTSTGSPWMTVNEARARQNLPAIEGGDELVVPMNVTVGGQASPRDSGTQNVNPDAPDRASAPAPAAKAPAAKAPEPTRAPDGVKSRRARAAASKAVATTLDKFFTRQARVLRSKKAKLDWDEDRWNDELAEDLMEVSRAQALAAAEAALKNNGGTYDEARTLAYLKESSARKAEAINAGTRTRLQEAIDAAEDWDEDGEPPDPFQKVLVDEAEGRANLWGATVAGFVVGFGMTEAARQNGGKKATKTWAVTSANPRDSHAAMDGETVPVDGTFSNGLDWPGGFGDPDEVAGCHCEVSVTW